MYFCKTHCIVFHQLTKKDFPQFKTDYSIEKMHFSTKFLEPLAAVALQFNISGPKGRSCTVQEYV